MADKLVASIVLACSHCGHWSSEEFEIEKTTDCPEAEYRICPDEDCDQQILTRPGIGPANPPVPKTEIPLGAVPLESALDLLEKQVPDKIPEDKTAE